MRKFLNWSLFLAIAVGSGLVVGGCYRSHDDSAFAEYKKREERFERWYKAERIKTEDALGAKRKAEDQMGVLKTAKENAESSITTEAKRYATYRGECTRQVDEHLKNAEESDKRKNAAEASLLSERSETARLRKELEASKMEAKKAREDARLLLEKVKNAGDEARKLLDEAK